MGTPLNNPTCEDRIEAEWERTREDFRRMIRAYEAGNEQGPSDLGPLEEYGLGFDYVAPGTWGPQQKEGYWRYQLSWGGPSDEFRFYSSSAESPPYRIEYWFLDWGDGASVNVTDDTIAQWLWDWFAGAGTTEYAQREAT